MGKAADERAEVTTKGFEVGYDLFASTAGCSDMGKPSG